MANLPFFLRSKRSEDCYEEIQGVKFFVHKGEKGKNALLAAEQAKLDEISDKFSPGFTLVAKLARAIAESEKIKLTKAYNIIISSDEIPHKDIDYQSIRIKYAEDFEALMLEDANALESFSGGFTISSKIAEKISKKEGYELKKAHEIVVYLFENAKLDKEELRLKYASEIGEMSIQLEREASAKKTAVCTIAIANRCWQALEDDLQSISQEDPEYLLTVSGIEEVQKWSDIDTKKRLSWGYIEDGWAFIERQRNGGKDPEPAEKQEITEDEIKKASEESVEPTGEKSTGGSKNSGRQKTDSSQNTLVASPSG